MLWVLYLRNYCLIQDCEELHLFTCKNFILLAFIFWSLIHFELFSYDISSSPASFVKNKTNNNSFPPPLNYLGRLIENQLNTNVLIVLMCLFMDSQVLFH